ncbi:hypothetical protein [Streptomyces aureus]|uniref:hypothetical protein n=1 Tax=Streptomyces aureus TaxID=193461 RepID=UPI00056AA425|nr:hypothetical protein [Streptomyces aureus]
MTTTTTDIPSAVLAALALPPLAGLDEPRASGRACVWERERLTIETAVDLGEQLAPADSASTIGQRWFPRSCHKHLAQRAHDALFTHSRQCDDCKVPDKCDVGRWMYRLMREHRR